MKKIVNNRYFSVTFLPGLVFGIVLDIEEDFLYIVLGCVEIDIKLWQFRRKKKNKFGSLKK
jgi:hypothetical protein